MGEQCGRQAPKVLSLQRHGLKLCVLTMCVLHLSLLNRLAAAASCSGTQADSPQPSVSGSGVFTDFQNLSSHSSSRLTPEHALANAKHQMLSNRQRLALQLQHVLTGPNSRTQLASPARLLLPHHSLQTLYPGGFSTGQRSTALRNVTCMLRELSQHTDTRLCPQLCPCEDEAAHRS